MSDNFRPSADAARAADPSTPIVTRKHPAGAQGAYISLKEVAKRILEGRLDPRVRAWAIQQLHKANRPRSHRDKSQALLEGLRRKALYVPDPVVGEFIQAARLTLCLDEGSTLCFAGGDCFPRGTMMLGERGLVPIERLEVGQRIWGLNDWSTVEAVVCKGVLKVDSIHLSNGATLGLTHEHHVYVEDITEGRMLPDERRIRVSELQAGMQMVQPSGFGRRRLWDATQYMLLPVRECLRNRINAAVIDGVGKDPKVLRIQRAAYSAECWDIQTSDHRVYLPEHDVTVSNCDDLCVAFGSAAMSIGIPVRVVGQSFDGTNTPTHVICAIQVESGDWLKVDPSSERWPVGQCSPATGELVLDPFDEDDKTSGLAGSAPTGDYVGVGAVPQQLERHWYPHAAGGWRYTDRLPSVGVGAAVQAPAAPGLFHAVVTNAATWIDYGTLGAALGVAGYVIFRLVKPAKP